MPSGPDMPLGPRAESIPVRHGQQRLLLKKWHDLDQDAATVHDVTAASHESGAFQPIDDGRRGPRRQTGMPRQCTGRRRAG